jgi:hypothetical protein
MTGIVSYGACVPLRRLGPATRDWSGREGRAVAGGDEDSLTMACQPPDVNVLELVQLPARMPYLGRG